MDGQPRVRIVRTSSRKIKPGLPVHMADLRRMLPTVQKTVDELDAHSPSASFETAADQMWRVVLCARAIAERKPPSGCTLHPDAVDPEPKPGWSTCLICNTWRKRGRPDRVVSDAPGPGWAAFEMTSAEEGMRRLHTVMYALNELAFRLRAESPEPERVELAEAALYGFMLLREMSRPVSRTGCVLHPQAVDENPPPGWGNCLICNTKRHQELRGNRIGQLKSTLPPSRAQSVQRAKQRAEQARQRAIGDRGRGQQ